MFQGPSFTFDRNLACLFYVNVNINGRRRRVKYKETVITGVFVMGRFFRRISASLMSVVILLSFVRVTVFADSTVSVKMKCNVYMTSARSMLSSVNSFRTSGKAWYWKSNNKTKYRCGKLSKLKYDYGLEQIAIQRAMEAAAKFSHERPNGEWWYTCSYDDAGSCGENIAVGPKTYKAAFKMWKEDDKKFGGQGHRRNMLDPAFESIGIAHVKLDGIDFWVQEFDCYKSSTPKTAAKNGKQTRSIPVDTSLAKSIKLKVSSVPNAKLGTENALPKITGRIKFSETWGTKGLPVKSVSGVTWKSSDTSVVSITDNKTFKAEGLGECTLTASFKFGSKTYKLKTSVKVILKGWIKEDGKRYYYDKNGNMVKGWKQISSKWYYFSKTTGAAVTGVKKLGGKYYLFSSKGVMQKSGWKTDAEGNTYYLKSSGEAYTAKWVKKSGEWYYFGSDGKMVKDTSLKIGKKTYKFREDGSCKNP